jgi:hypothetical protein
MRGDGRSRRRGEVIDALTNMPIEQLLAAQRQLKADAEQTGITSAEFCAALSARPDHPRPLLPIERDTLLAILGYGDFEGRDELVAQVDSATVVGYCGCGCATVDLEVDPDAPRAHATENMTIIPNEATVLDADGEPIGGIIVFVDNGCLSRLEIYDWLDPTGISPLPPVDRLQLKTDR